MKKNILLFLLLISHVLSAKIWLPSIISDHMVLQQNSEATLWGWTTAVDETISVTGSWNNKTLSVKAPRGLWSVQLPTPSAGGPYTITIKGHEEIELKNVMIGEVWIASGQSNMEWTPIMGIDKANEEIANASYPDIRFFKVNKKISSGKQDDLLGEWQECTPNSLKNFSSVAYFFGRRLHEQLDVPIGLINSSWGGTNAEVWIPKDVLKTNKELLQSIDQIKASVWWPKDPGVAYNAMIHPLISFDIAGAIWYQGESNRANAHHYRESFALLIKTWRDLWKKNLPFYFVQIAPFDYQSATGLEGALVQESQLKTMLEVPNTGIVVTNDIGNLKNIHPTNKQDVGKRLANWALAKTYGIQGIPFSGPLYKSMEIKGKSIVISFDHIGEGLKTKGKELTEFYIAGNDQVFYKAKARIVGNKVKVSSSQVKDPVAVRFAFSETAQPNLFNSYWLPASGFRTDNWKIKF